MYSCKELNRGKDADMLSTKLMVRAGKVLHRWSLEYSSTYSGNTMPTGVSCSRGPVGNSCGAGDSLSHTFKMWQSTEFFLCKTRGLPADSFPWAILSWVGNISESAYKHSSGAVCGELQILCESILALSSYSVPLDSVLQQRQNLSSFWSDFVPNPYYSQNHIYTFLLTWRTAD